MPEFLRVAPTSSRHAVVGLGLFNCCRHKSVLNPAVYV